MGASKRKMKFNSHFAEVSSVLGEILLTAPTSTLRRDPSRFSPYLWSELTGSQVSEWCKTNAGANHCVRQIHDYYGWMAKNGKRGKCAGALYRSEQFMNLPKPLRNGSRGIDRNIHIEHVVPVAVLVKSLVFASATFASPNDLHRFLMSHSICVAITYEEQKSLDLAGVPRSSNDAFSESGKPLHQCPFQRYLPLREFFKGKEKPLRLFNVVTKQEIEIENFSFSDHVKTMNLAAEESGASANKNPYHLDIFDSKLWALDSKKML